MSINDVIPLLHLSALCVPSLLNAKDTCSFMRQLVEDRLVLRSLYTPQIPLLIEEKNFAVQRLLDRCNDCGNLHAKFRLAMLHFFCKEKNFMFGNALLDWLASRGLRRAIYMWVLLTLILGVKGEPQMEARMFHYWGKIWEERKIFGIRESLESWFPIFSFKTQTVQRRISSCGLQGLQAACQSNRVEAVCTFN